MKQPEETITMKQPFTFFRILAALALFCAGIASAANYSRVNEPPLPPAFIPLPPGAVHPEGWLLDWCNLQRDGLTGHADDIHFTEKNNGNAKNLDLGDVYRIGWTGQNYTGKGGNAWSLEQSGYWLDGIVRLGLVLQDSALLKKAKIRIDSIVKHSAVGKSFCWWENGWAEAWPSAVVGRALVAYYEGTGDPAVLKTLENAYSGFPAGGGSSFSRDESNLESMLEAYSLGASGTLLTKALSSYKAREGGEINSWANNSISAAHGVTWNERAKLPVIAYPWTSNKAYLNASVNSYNWAESNHGLPFGVMSASESLNGVGAFKSTESCDVSDFTLSNLWLYRVTGSRLYGDWIERAVFNAGAQTMARDCKTHVYFQSPNRIDADNPSNLSPNPNGGTEPQFYLPAHFPQCCTSNLDRITPNYVIHMWMATYDNGLAMTLYGPSKVTAMVGDKVSATLTTTTNYPFDQTLHTSVTLASPATFPLYFRIPQWCANPRISVNGANVSAAPDANGFAKVSRAWSTGDAIDIVLPMLPRIRKFGGSGNSPGLSVYCGPLLYALPIPESSDNAAGSGGNYKYALDFNSQDSVVITRTAMPASWNWPSASPVTLSVPAVAVNWGPGALPTNFSSGSAKTMLKLVPYGNLKFRVSMFPTTQAAYAMSEFVPVKGAATVSVIGKHPNGFLTEKNILSFRGATLTFVKKDAMPMRFAIVDDQSRTVYAAPIQSEPGSWSLDLSQLRLGQGMYTAVLYSGGKVVERARIMARF
jgi:uncharacterized protein